MSRDVLLDRGRPHVPRRGRGPLRVQVPRARPHPIPRGLLLPVAQHGDRKLPDRLATEPRAARCPQQRLGPIASGDTQPQMRCGRPLVPYKTADRPGDRHDDRVLLRVAHRTGLMREPEVPCVGEMYAMRSIRCVLALGGAEHRSTISEV